MAEPMEDDDLLDLLDEDYRDAQQYTDDVIGPDRDKAMRYYLGEPMGDERPGRSSVISREVFKVVEGVATAIAEIYASTESAVEFLPRRASGVDQANQRTQAVRYVLFTQNDGFTPIVEAIKDGVHLKTGFLTWRWEKSRRMTQERYRGLSGVAVALLTKDNPDVKVVEEVARLEVVQGPNGPEEIEVFDLRVNIVKESGQIVVESVPPEEILVSSRTRGPVLDKAPAVIWRTEKTREELIKCGYDEELVEQIAFSGYVSDSPVVRRREDGDTRMLDTVELRTHWREVDYDGDGVVELRRIVRAGDVILENEIIDEINLSGWTPNIQPHEYFGRCPADEATEGQEVTTVLMRQTLDNIYLSNTPMLRVDAGLAGVNIADFYDPEIGRPVRAPQGAVEPIAIPFVAHHSFGMIEQLQADQENKTGWTRYAQGMDAKSLNQTARGISIITNMSQARVKMMARNFGEMCLKPAMRGISKLLSQHASGPMTVRLTGEKFVDIDPREWSEEFDMTVNVGLGITDKDQQLIHLQAMAAAQAQAVAGGALGTLVTLKNLYNVQAKIAENAGFKDPAFAWTDPDTVQEPQQPPQPTPAQLEMEKTRLKVEADKEVALFKAAKDAELEHFRAQLKADTELQIAQIRANAAVGGAFPMQAQEPML